MRKIKKIKDVVDWGLCTGCGACYFFCDRNAVTMKNVYSLGIIACIDEARCQSCTQCLDFCPGYGVDSSAIDRGFETEPDYHPLVGPAAAVWEGFAADSEIRYQGSSGGALSALALYCLEKRGMHFALHVGPDPKIPWGNISKASSTREDILHSAGSRYAPSSPCAHLDLIEKSGSPCVFIGRPCDAAAVNALRKLRPKLDANLGLVLTFFCAGPPCSRGTVDLIQNLGIDLDSVASIRFRGRGWPGRFTVTYGNGEQKTLSYKESWGKLASSYRSMRCHLCPDGLGECADISCGDAWHRHSGDANPGMSLILARTEKGRRVVENAMRAQYLILDYSNFINVVEAQGLVRRRMELFGRLLARKLLFVPIPRFNGFDLRSAWYFLSSGQKLKTVAGTLRRIVMRGLWRKAESLQWK